MAAKFGFSEKATLDITLVGGKDLAAKDSNGLSDPFVVISAPGKHGKTSVVKKSLNPSWNEKWREEVEKGSLKAHFEVRDHNSILKSEYMGECDLEMPKDLTSEPREIIVPLEARGKHASEKVSGSLIFKLELHDSVTGLVNRALEGIELPKGEHRVEKESSNSKGCNFLSQIEPKCGTNFSLGEVALDSKDRVIVSDDSAKDASIQIYDQEGNLVTKLLQNLVQPHFCVDNEDNIYVVDEESLKITKLDKDGNVLGSFGTKGFKKEPAVFMIYAHLAIDKKTNNLLVDSFGGIQIFNSKFEFVNKIVAKEGPGNFENIGPIAVNSKGHIIKSDKLKVLTYDMDGNFISAFGEKGEPEGKLDYITNLAVDSADRIYIADGQQTMRVQIFSPSGQHLHTFSRVEGERLNSLFVCPKTGKIYVYGSSAIRIFSPFTQ